MDALEKEKKAGNAPKPPVRAIPAGMRTVTPYLIVPDAKRMIEFAKKAFHAREKFRSDSPQGGVAHAEIWIGDSVIMLADASKEFAPRPAMLNLYVENVDDTYRHAIAAGAKSLREPETQFYGDRSAGVEDLAGNQWWISTHVEDVTPEEIERRAKEKYAKASR